MSDVVIRVTIDSQGAESGSRRVNQSLQQTQRDSRATGREVNRLERGFSSFSRVAMGLGGVLAGALSVRAVTNFARTAISEFSDLETSLWRIERQADLMGHAWADAEYINEFAREIGRATLGSAEEVRQATSLILTQQDITQESYEQTIKVAQSLSEVTGVNMPTAARYMTRAMSDASGAMSMFQRYGIVFTESQQEQIKALQESGQEAEAYAMMLEMMSQILPDATKEGDTLAHSLDSQGEEARRLRETIGGYLAPAYQRLIDQNVTLLERMNEIAESDLPDFFRGLNRIMEPVPRTVRNVTDRFSEFLDEVERSTQIDLRGTLWDTFLQTTPWGRVYRETRNLSGAITELGREVDETVSGWEQSGHSARDWTRQINETGNSTDDLSDSIAKAEQRLRELTMSAEELQILEVYEEFEMWRSALEGQDELLYRLADAFDDYVQGIREASGQWLTFEEMQRRTMEGIAHRHAQRRGDFADQEIAEYERMIEAGGQWLTEEELQLRAAQEIAKRHAQRRGDFADQEIEAMERINQARKTMLERMEYGFWDMQDVAVSSLRTLEDTLIDVTTTGKLEFRDMVDSILRDLAKVAIQQSIIQPLAGFMGGFSLFSAKGHAFDKGEVQPFAKGGIVNRPTVFPFSRGIGLMGEEGPEAIMPLTRTPSGDLGVKAQNGTREVQVHIHNESGQKMEVTDSKARFDAQAMIIDLWLDGFQRNKHGLRTAIGG
jgi:lambda family phage tail tape measure protein